MLSANEISVHVLFNDLVGFTQSLFEVWFPKAHVFISENTEASSPSELEEATMTK